TAERRRRGGKRGERKPIQMFFSALISATLRLRGQSRATIIELMAKNSFGAAAKLRAGGVESDYYRLARLEEQGVGNVGRLPFSIRILLENLLRHEDGRRVST